VPTSADRPLTIGRQSLSGLDSDYGERHFVDLRVGREVAHAGDRTAWLSSKFGM
jgi:hypothetical protein